MYFFDYIGVTPEQFEADYVAPGYVSRSKHKTFPLDLYTYGRPAVHEDKWDGVTTKCRGIIVHRETGEVIARPFEKFFNFGSIQGSEVFDEAPFNDQPVVWEKMDGFLCTAYNWEDKWYVASKGSFHSIHAKWATAEFKRGLNTYVTSGWPPGWTPVFEGIHPDLRIVVDYGAMSRMVLLALINIETREEMSPDQLRTNAMLNGYVLPNIEDMTWQRALEESKIEYKDGLGVDEGYVLTWYRKGKPPLRLKVKFTEYLRLHRIVTGVSAKRVLEVLANSEEETLKQWLENTTPAFAKFAKKWTGILQAEYDSLDQKSKAAHAVIQGVLKQQYDQTGVLPVRKDWALMLQRPEFKESASAVFAMMDGKDVKQVLWKAVRPLTSGVGPIVDAHQ